jgi:tRNA1Val (adenine37-N6)-methyltransferase
MAFFPLALVLRGFPAAAYEKYALPQYLVRPCPAKKILIYEWDTLQCHQKAMDGHYLVSEKGYKESMEAITSDTFFDGRLQVRQYRNGYRFSIDAVILADHIRPHPGETVLDLGAGCGIISLILAFRYTESTVIGVEIQPELADLARVNVRVNGMQARIRILCEDMKGLDPARLPGPVDWVAANPPYRKTNTGRVNPHPQRAVARHEIKVALPDVIAAARRVLRTGGKLVTIYTAERMTEVLHQMQSSGIEPKFCRMIHSDTTSNAKLVLIEGVKGGHPGMVVAPPLVIYRENGDYTTEIEKMFRP